MHSRRTASPEKIAGTAGYRQFLAFFLTGIHPHNDSLLAYAGAVCLQVVLKDFYDRGFLKSLSLSGDKLCFFNLIYFHCKYSKKNTNKN